MASPTYDRRLAAPVTSSADFRDPFYASTIPQVYALAATTVIAYMLVIVLFITPRSFLAGGIIVLGRRGFTNGPSGSAQGIGIGGRPWLQKVAALTVAISLTIATADTFRVAEEQYLIGYTSAVALQNEVLDSQELKIIRMVSDTFLWLAQAQTLIRLFPRQREKVIIKWTAFILITFNLLFSLLNTFVYSTNGLSKPYNISEAIPALSYVFHLGLGVLYGAWVIYYAFTKRTYAFYHPKMRNICLVALMAVTSVIVPVVFFVLDISKPNVAGWGDYVRWVGAAAASVVVWEWVERIEALERIDKKDGVLGREVFDGDDMLEVMAMSDLHQGRRRPRSGDEGSGAASTGAGGNSWPTTRRYRIRDPELSERNENWEHEDVRNQEPGRQRNPQLPRWPIRPPAAVTPVSRTETGSVASTVYTVRYHPISESREYDETAAPQSSPVGDGFDVEARVDAPPHDASEDDSGGPAHNTQVERPLPKGRQAKVFRPSQRLNPFRRTAQMLPPEVSPHTRAKQSSSNDTSPRRWDILGRLEDFAAEQADRLRDKNKPPHESASLPVTRIPAPPRRHNLEDLLEELDSVEPRESSNVTRPMASTSASNWDTNPMEHAVLDRSPRPRISPDIGDAEATAVAHRGNISFAPLVQRDRDHDRRATDTDDGRDSMDTHSGVRSPPPRGSSPLYMPRHGGHPQTGHSDARLPVLRIPAPPRRSRSED